MKALDDRLLGIGRHTSKYLEVLQYLLRTFVKFKGRGKILTCRRQIIFRGKRSNLAGNKCTNFALIVIALPVHRTQRILLEDQDWLERTIILFL